jgi:hypothetical protein
MAELEDAMVREAMRLSLLEANATVPARRPTARPQSGSTSTSDSDDEDEDEDEDELGRAGHEEDDGVPMSLRPRPRIYGSDGDDDDDDDDDNGETARRVRSRRDRRPPRPVRAPAPVPPVAPPPPPPPPPPPRARALVDDSEDDEWF